MPRPSTLAPPVSSTYQDMWSPCSLVVFWLPSEPTLKSPFGVQFFSAWVLHGSSLVLGRPFPVETAWLSVVPSLQVTVIVCADWTTAMCVIFRGGVFFAVDALAL